MADFENEFNQPKTLQMQALKSMLLWINVYISSLSIMMLRGLRFSLWFSTRVLPWMLGHAPIGIDLSKILVGQTKILGGCPPKSMPMHAPVCLAAVHNCYLVHYAGILVMFTVTYSL